MKKVSLFTIYLGLWIICLFSAGMALTFMSDYLQQCGFFGDISRSTATKDDWPTIDVMHDWGARHYWYFWMGFLLFLISVARIVMWVIYYWRIEIDIIFKDENNIQDQPPHNP